MLGITTTNARVGGFRGGISAEAKTIYNRIIADGGVSNLSRLNFFVKGLKSIYGDLANVPVCYDAHWIGYKLGSGTGATAGQAAAKLYSLTVAGDAVQTTAASQPLLLAHSGASSDNYWWGSGVANNYVSTPITVLSSTTTDFEIKAQINLQNYSSNAYSIIGQFVATNNNFLLYIRNGKLEIYFVVAGTGYNYNSTVAVGFTNNTDGYIKVTRESVTGAVKYYTSTDGSTYTQLGATLSGVTGVITPPTSTDLEIGMYGTSLSSFLGKIFRLTIANSIGGTPVVDFNPATYNAATSQTAWTSATGEVWTINTGTATSGYKGALVSRTIVQGDGVDDRLASGTLTTYQYLSRYTALVPYTNSNAGQRYIAGLDASHLLYNFNTGQIRSYNGLDLDFSGELVNKLQLFTENFNNTLSTIKLNNTITVSGLSGIRTSNVVSVFSTTTPALFSNAILNTVILTLAVDDSTNNTATYNLIKSLNESAF